MSLLTFKSILLFLTLALVTACAKDGKQYMNEGNELMRHKKYAEAILAFDEGIKLKDKFEVQCKYRKAACFYELNEFEKAKSIANDCLLTERSNKRELNTQIYWLKAGAANGLNDIDLQIESFRKAIKYSPDVPMLKVTYALALIERDRNEEGIKIITKEIEQGLEHSYAHNNRAHGYINLGELEKAEKDLQKALELDEENPFIYKNYYLLYKTQGDKSMACNFMAIALEKDVLNYGQQKDLDLFKKMEDDYCNK